MHPRTLIITIASILGCSIGLRAFLDHSDWFNPSEEAYLKRAIAITVYYSENGNSRTCLINNRDEIRELLALLRFDQPLSREYYGRMTYLPTAQFTFPDSTSRQYSLFADNSMDGRIVDPAFFRKLAEIVSRHENKEVKLFDNK